MHTQAVRRAIRNPSRHWLLAASSILLLVLAGCVSLPPQPTVSTGDIAWVLAGADLLPASSETAPEDLPSLLHVTAGMREFAENATHHRSSIAGKTRALAAAMGAEQGLHLQYDSSATLTAEQAFTQRRANCLSYTLLFVALAREVGIPAQFNEVDVPPIWDLGDDKVSLLYKHVNARIELTKPFAQIIDVSAGEYDPGFEQHVISDAVAQAQFYNNRAVEMRLQQRYADALRYQLRALALSPDADYLWSNLASLYLLDGSPRAARIAVTRALTLDASSMISYDIAAQAYEQLGERRLAAYFHDRAEQFLDQNPYHHYQLALAALNAHDDKLAYNETRRAVLLYPRDHRFFFLLAVLLDRLGEKKLADQSMQTAITLAPDASQQDRYKSKFARLAKRT
jgi:tetratricopeptide (TPR) repeat protein